MLYGNGLQHFREKSTRLVRQIITVVQEKKITIVTTKSRVVEDEMVEHY